LCFQQFKYQVPLGGKASGRDADLALVRLQVVRGMHGENVKSAKENNFTLFQSSAFVEIIFN
jgi:hypothetical protein